VKNRYHDENISRVEFSMINAYTYDPL